MSKLKNKVALITGGTRGMGRAVESLVRQAAVDYAPGIRSRMI